MPSVSMVTSTQTRKQRSDKKREIKSNLPVELRETLQSRADLVGVSLKEYVEQLVLTALSSESVIRGLAPYFRRGYVPLYDKSRVIMGHVIAPKLEPLLPEGTDFQRISSRFVMDDYMRIGEIQYALACPAISTATTILINEAVIQNVQIIGTN